MTGWIQLGAVSASIYLAIYALALFLAVDYKAGKVGEITKVTGYGAFFLMLLVIAIGVIK